MQNMANTHGVSEAINKIEYATEITAQQRQNSRGVVIRLAFWSNDDPLIFLCIYLSLVYIPVPNP